MKPHLEFASDVPVLREERVGRYRVQAFRYPDPDFDGSHPIAYRVLVEEWEGAWRKIRCWTDAEERAFPKRAAEAGSRMVAKLKAIEHAHPKPQGLVRIVGTHEPYTASDGSVVYNGSRTVPMTRTQAARLLREYRRTSVPGYVGTLRIEKVEEGSETP